MRLLLAASTTALLLGFAIAATAHDGPHAAGEGHDPADAAAATEDSVADVQQDLIAAKQRVDRAEAAYTLMLSRNYPRGDARAEIIQERQAARESWDALAAAHPDLAAALGSPASN